jgi:hypothetical protein
MRDKVGAVGNEADSVVGYAREIVEDFLEAAGRERVRLQATIRDAESRERRARAAIGLSSVMATMFLEAQREIAELRSDAEAEAAKILTIADCEVDEAHWTARYLDPACGAYAVDLTADSRAVGSGSHADDDFFAFLAAGVDDVAGDRR